MIRYGIFDGNEMTVHLDGKKIGDIIKVEGGFQYFPNKMKEGGEIFPTIKGVKLSLEED